MRGPGTFTGNRFTLRKLEDFVPACHPLRPARQMLNAALVKMDALFSGTNKANIKGAIKKSREKDVIAFMMTHEHTPFPAPGQCATPEQCTIRINLSQRISELESRVSTDALTGLWNRAHFDHVLEKELDRSLRHKQPVSLILFDIDHFKHINDEFGHQAGDEVLREIARIGSAVIRSSDALFRWGGDEFVILAPSTGYRGAAHLAESLRREAASHRFPSVGSLTLSLGVTEHAESNESAESWFQRTDGMLYAAKGDGRNSVRVDTRGSSDLWATGHGRSALHLVWQESYECGEPAIDSEHRELFRLANELIDAFIASEKRFDGVTRAYDRLLAHITLHFANEEALLTQHGFAGLDTHRRAHASLLARARDLRNTVASGGAGLGGIIDFLAVKMVAHHILKTDRDFFPLFSGSACLPAN